MPLVLANYLAEKIAQEPSVVRCLFREEFLLFPRMLRQRRRTWKSFNMLPLHVRIRKVDQVDMRVQSRLHRD